MLYQGSFEGTDHFVLQNFCGVSCISGLVQNFGISSALAMEILQSYSKPSISTAKFLKYNSN